ncbi:MAG: hypothetical protein M1834_005847 [Cirrosporium novae-zelandiae]|nr:MAG: hypothetical protein M1834_005847 [Cirrosporium novae-zelandiae]
MDIKSSSPPFFSPSPTNTRLRRFVISALFTFGLLTLLGRFSTVFQSALWSHNDAPTAPPATESEYLVPLEAHIMSKCPDAKDCMRDLLVPTMQQVSDKTQFTLSFIGTTDPDSDAVECKHGETECLGNMLIVCASHLYPSPVIHLGFAMCMVGQFNKIPERAMVENCALEHGVDFGKLNDCVSEEGEGIGLLRESMERSQNAGVTKSCTIRLDNKIRCIRDGAEWKDCEGGYTVKSLVNDVEAAYKKGNGL